MKRLCIYAHFDPHGLIDPYVIHQLEQYRKVFDDIIFVSTHCQLDEIKKIKPLTNQQMIRKNMGYDFLSWKTGLSLVDYKEYDEMIFTNDSVYGPLFDIEPLINFWQTSDCDYFSMTESIEVQTHLQSYFLVFKKNVFQSSAFHAWLASIENQASKKDYVTKYEVSLSEILRAHGFKSACIYSNRWSLHGFIYIFIRWLKKIMPSKKSISQMQSQIQHQAYSHFFNSWVYPNPTLYNWQVLISKVPLIKTQLFKSIFTPTEQKLCLELIKQNTNYPIHLIENHLQRFKSPS